MQIGYTMVSGRGDMDLLLAQVAERLHQERIQTSGVVQFNTDCARGGPCDMDVRVLPDGPMVRISQSLGLGARGCRLDPDALEQAVALCAERLPNAGVLLVNKFGKHEAQGRGFRDLIGDALSQDIPVIVGINRLNLDSFQEFTGGAGEELQPDLDTLVNWAMAAARPGS